MQSIIVKILLIAIPFIVYSQVGAPLYTGSQGIYTPTKSIKELRDLSKDIDSANTQAKGIASKAIALKNEYSKIKEEDKEKLSKMLPEKIDIVRLLDEVTYMTAQSGFEVGQIAYVKLEKTANEGNSREGYKISYEVKGNYPRFKRLIQNIENSLRIYTIPSISFSGELEKDTQGVVTSVKETKYKVELETYVLNTQ